MSIRRDTITTATLRAQLDQLKKTGRYECFELKRHPAYYEKDKSPFLSHLFWDSDLGKWIEGVYHFLSDKHDADIDAAVKYIASTIREA